MGAGGFGTLASHFPDRTVVTYDPRGVERSTKADPASPSTPERARRRPASDHRRARRRPGRPVRQQRRRGERAGPRGEAPGGGPDARRARAAARARSCPTARARWRPPRRSTTRISAAGFGAGMAQFIVAVGHKGPIDRGVRRASRRPTRRCSGCPPRTTATRTDPLLCQNIVTCTHYEPDFDALRAASTRIVPGRRRGVGGRDGAPRRARPSPSVSAPTPVDLPERPRRLPRRRIRPDRRARRLRREAARGPFRGLTTV